MPFLIDLEYLRYLGYSGGITRGKYELSSILGKCLN